MGRAVVGTITEAQDARALSDVAEVIRRDGSREEYAVVTGLTVDEGDVIRIRTGNGGGYGDPRDRDPVAIEADLRNGLLTPERAREIYGHAP